MQKGFTPVVIVLILLVLGGLAGGGYFLYQKNQQRQVNSYGECLKSEGSKILEMYPSVCVTKDGKRFAQLLSDEEKKKLQPLQSDQKVCAQIITPAKNPKTGECKDFPTPCDMPQGWDKVDECVNNLYTGCYKNKESKIDAEVIKKSKSDQSIFITVWCKDYPNFSYIEDAKVDAIYPRDKVARMTIPSVELCKLVEDSNVKRISITINAPMQ